ncbi:PaaI family thioesterase [Altererythrobacter sp. MF3-039]|uniref:PaaI family thioesterase n=1 Tax=Altererythrobacter sp. MF3-039 TaxID=3252901 RepID=UPI00390C640E
MDDAGQAELPEGFTRADFSPGFLDHGGPYYLKPDGERQLVGLRLLDQHMNYRDMAHGGVLSTFADVAMSWQVYCSEDPPVPISTITLAVNFLGSARLGDWLVADMRIDRKGRQVAYCSGRIMRGDDVLATASASFALMRPK